MMGHIGPKCHEICEDCFNILSPIEEVSVGRIITTGEYKNPEVPCDLCGQKYQWAKAHHIDCDHAALVQHYAKAVMAKALEGFVGEEPTVDMKQKVFEQMQETLKKLYDVIFDKMTKRGEYIVQMPPYGLVRLGNMQVTEGEEEGQVKITMDVKPL